MSSLSSFYAQYVYFMSRQFHASRKLDTRLSSLYSSNKLSSHNGKQIIIRKKTVLFPVFGNLHMSIYLITKIIIDFLNFLKCRRIYG